jgi:hypothetical protein
MIATSIIASNNKARINAVKSCSLVDPIGHNESEEQRKGNVVPVGQKNPSGQGNADFESGQ